MQKLEYSKEREQGQGAKHVAGSSAAQAIEKEKIEQLLYKFRQDLMGKSSV